MANRSRIDIQSANKLLHLPVETKTFPKPAFVNDVDGIKHDGGQSSVISRSKFKSRNLHSPPPDLDGMMVKVRSTR